MFSWISSKVTKKLNTSIIAKFSVILCQVNNWCNIIFSFIQQCFFILRFSITLFVAGAYSNWSLYGMDISYGNCLQILTNDYLSIKNYLSINNQFTRSATSASLELFHNSFWKFLYSVAFVCYFCEDFIILRLFARIYYIFQLKSVVLFWVYFYESSGTSQTFFKCCCLLIKFHLKLKTDSHTNCLHEHPLFGSLVFALVPTTEKQRDVCTALRCLCRSQVIFFSFCFHEGAYSCWLIF